MLNGLALMWGAKTKPIDPESFCWIGNGRTEIEQIYKDGDRPEDHLTNAIAAKIFRDGGFDLEACLAEYERWTTLPADTEATAQE